MVQIGRKTRGLQRSSLCRLTGNFSRPNRDLNRAIRVIFGLIRELGAGAPAPDLAGASAKKRTAHVFPKGARRVHARSAACAGPVASYLPDSYRVRAMGIV